MEAGAERTQNRIMRTGLVFIISSLLLCPGILSMAQDSTPVAPDNTKMNVRDRPADAMTAGQQSNANGDIELTRKIRQAVVKDSSLSTMAHNVKIISNNGSVTLRGPVKTQGEKDAIAEKAQTIAGSGKVDNQLEIKNQ